MNDTEVMEKYPPKQPNAALVWTAVVDVGERGDLGPSEEGHRYVVPILGGNVYPGPGFEDLSGVVLKGGSDWQLLRPDGVKELDAKYDMEVGSAVVLKIRNRVLIDESRKPDRYAMSVIQVTAPKGPLAWLNRRLLLGTLQTARPERLAVVVRAWMMDV